MSEFANFLSDEEVFKLEMEKYIPEYFEHQRAGTLHTDDDFKAKTIKMVELSKAAGIDLQQFINERLG